MTNARSAGTNSGATVTTALPPAGRWGARLAALSPRQAYWAFVASFVLIALAHAGVNSVSVASDLGRGGIAFRASEPWIWEFTSVLALIAWLVPLLAADAALRARVRSLPARLVVLALGSVVYSAAHVVTMVALRQAAYGLAGWPYDFGPWGAGFVYEYRKDVLTYATILALAAGWRLLLARERRAAAAGADAAQIEPAAQTTPAAAPSNDGPSPATAPTFLVRTAQGDLLVRAQDVDWIEAQGNYVGLHVQGQVRLLRQTLAEMQVRLADHGFIRTHRGALVNRQRMQAIIPRELGELGVRLANGEVAPLSESRRAEVVRLAVGEQAASSSGTL